MNYSNEYLETYKNEIYLSKYWSILSGYEDRILFNECRLPRKLRKSFLLYIVKYLYCFLFFLYCTYFFLKTTFLWIITPKFRPIEGDYLLAVDNISKEMYDRIVKHTSVSNIIFNDGVYLSYLKSDSKSLISVYSLLAFHQLVATYFHSLEVLIRTYNQFGLFYSLLSFNAPKWLLFRYAIDSIPHRSTIYSAYHKDRWALLVDKIQVDNKVLIQHGTEFSTNPNSLSHEFTQGKYCQQLPYRMSSITKVLTFSDDEYLALTSSILSNKPEKIIIGYHLLLTNTNELGFKILIIGHAGLYGNVEREIVKKLAVENIIIYLKNHPTQNRNFYDGWESMYGVHLIDAKIFPKVDLVISYESTLAKEYEATNIKVLYHTKSTIADILLEIKKIKCKHSI